MEETGVCHPIAVPSQVQIQFTKLPDGVCAAKLLGAEQRQQLAVHAMAGSASITQLAAENQVSRKFVHQQVDKAAQALDEAFNPQRGADDEVLFYLPVTRAWLRQLVLALTLICHSALRGVIELLRDLFDIKLSLGTVHNILAGTVAQAREHNRRQDLSHVRHGLHDEIFQSKWAVLVGVDAASTYCYLLSPEEHRDAETWAIRLWELQEQQGFNPETITADGGGGLRAGQALAMPGTPCRADVFHALYDVYDLVRYLENRAYDACTAAHKLQRQQDRAQKRHGRCDAKVTRRLTAARVGERSAIALADAVAVLARWLEHDILSVAGPEHAQRCQLLDFIVAELRAREELCPHRIKPVADMLHHQRDNLLDFAAQLDRDLQTLAAEFQVDVAVVRELFNIQTLDERRPQRWQKEAVLRQQLRSRFYHLSETLKELADRVVRASSLVENFNSRLRAYFFLRRHLGPDYLELLRFFLNHRRFLRSERPERVGKSPAELLQGAAHPHWLEMLGYQPFSRN
jgi:hypothetical protein